MTSDMHVSKDKVKHLHDPERFCPYIFIEMEISKQAEKRVVSGFRHCDASLPIHTLESLFNLHARGEFHSKGTWLYRFVAKYYVRQGVFKNFNSRLRWVVTTECRPINFTQFKLYLGVAELHMQGSGRA